MWTCRRWSWALSTAGGSIKGHRTRAAGTRSSSFLTDRRRTPTPMATIGYARMGWPALMAGRPAHASKPLRAAWLDAGSLDEQRRICVELQMQLWQDVTYIPMGEYWQSTAYRKDLLDVLPGLFRVFYGVRRG